MQRLHYNVSLGAVTAQLALRRDANGRLVRDPAADRTYHKDHLGSTALVTASDGSITAETGDAGRLEYAPYGEELLTDAGARRIHIRYTGKETDDETGLTYYGARYAHAGLGRWVSRDPRVLSDPAVSLRDEQDANLYAFVAHKPTKLTDPDGLCPICPMMRARALAEALPRAVDAAPQYIQVAVDIASLADQTPISNFASAGISALRGDWQGVKLSLAAAFMTLTVVGDEALEAKKIYHAVDALETAGDASRILGTGTEAGIVYQRLNPSTGEEYVGQTKSPARLNERKGEHDRSLLVKHEYEVLGTAEPGKALDLLEEDMIRKKGGLKKEGGTLVNKRHQMSEKKYETSGGKVDDPTKKQKKVK